MAARVVSSTETAGAPLGKSIASSPSLRGKIWTILSGGRVKLISMGKPKEKNNTGFQWENLKKKKQTIFSSYIGHIIMGFP